LDASSLPAASRGSANLLTRHTSWHRPPAGVRCDASCPVTRRRRAPRPTHLAAAPRCRSKSQAPAGSYDARSALRRSPCQEFVVIELNRQAYERLPKPKAARDRPGGNTPVRGTGRARGRNRTRRALVQGCISCRFWPASEGRNLRGFRPCSVALALAGTVTLSNRYLSDLVFVVREVDSSNGVEEGALPSHFPAI
jgi:hypothetical protein